MAKLKLIGVCAETKQELDKLKIHPRETYNQLIVRKLNLGNTKDNVLLKQ